MVDLQSTRLTAAESERLADPLVGGVILFSRNIQSPGQVEELCHQVRKVCPDLLLTVDQEGGRVQRLRRGWAQLPPMRVHGRELARDPERAESQAREHGWLMATEVLSSGLDLSFAPVLDLDVGISAVIGDRALADTPEGVVRLARAFIDGMHEAGMAATGKHFPGHGHVAADSHLELPDDDRSFAAMERTDLSVFSQCMPLLDGIMPAHVRYSSVDESPAGFSRFWLREVLRQRLGFNGVIFSDDLSMAGAAVAGDMPARVDAALAAGCDCLLVCNDPGAAGAALNHLAAADLDTGDRRPLSTLIRPEARRRARDSMGGQRWRRACELMLSLEGVTQ
ncbi:MAG: beta-N-acetylhexosaminidase [Pseudomonadota bacterium]